MSAFSANPVEPLRYRIAHETRYVYQNLVTQSQQFLHLTPRSFQYQQTESHQILVVPAEEERNDGIDYFGNNTKHISIMTSHKMLIVHAESTVAIVPRYDLARIKDTLAWESVRGLLHQVRSDAILDACRYLFDSSHIRCSPMLAEYARFSYTTGRPHLEAALDLTQRIFKDFEFDPRATEISTPLEEVLKGRRGVCQDFAHLMIGCLRSLGLSARYVSGYIMTHPPAGQPRMIGADASHAWVSVFCPILGWVDFDPTNSCMVNFEHITLGWGRDFSDVTPLRGIVRGGGKQELAIAVTVTALAATTKEMV